MHHECSFRKIEIFLNFSYGNLYQTPKSLILLSTLLSGLSHLPATPCPGTQAVGHHTDYS